MTNTRITDAEVFERRYPVVLREFSLRKGSGGRGQHRGGDGVVRDIEFRIPVQVSILSERRVFRPYGLEGGEDAQCGMNVWVRKVARSAGGGSSGASDASSNGAKGARSNGAKSASSTNSAATATANVTNATAAKDDNNTNTHETRLINLGGKNTAAMQPGERIIIMTPGGGGWGRAGAESVAAAARAKTQDPRHAWRGGSVAARQSMAEASA